MIALPRVGWIGLTRSSPNTAAAPAADDTRPPPSLRVLLLALAFSVTLASRLGLRVGSHPFDSSFVAVMALLVLLGARGWLRIDPVQLLLYACTAAIATLSLVVNRTFGIVPSSVGSIALLLAVYLPFLATLHAPGRSDDHWRWTRDMFGTVALGCACAGIVQFYLQFVIQDPWLFDYARHVPWRLQGPGGYNTVIEVGSLYKSNGFFLREPSHFSFLMALGLLIELESRRRLGRMALLAFALLLTYSGTGLLALALGLLFPLGRRTLVQASVLALLGFLVFFVLGDALNLDFTLGRLAEFGSERSSAYIRYVAPLKVVAEEIGSDPWAVLLGHGPGTMQRTLRGIQSFDPTWAKLLFEYGLLGLLSVLGLMLRAVTRCAAPMPVRVALFMNWLVMGGYLLSPDTCVMVYLLLGAWPTSCEPPPGGYAGPAPRGG